MTFCTRGLTVMGWTEKYFSDSPSYFDFICFLYLIDFQCQHQQCTDSEKQDRPPDQGTAYSDCLHHRVRRRLLHAHWDIWMRTARGNAIGEVQGVAPPLIYLLTFKLHNINFPYLQNSFGLKVLANVWAQKTQYLKNIISHFLASFSTVWPPYWKGPSTASKLFSFGRLV